MARLFASAAPRLLGGHCVVKADVLVVAGAISPDKLDSPVSYSLDMTQPSPRWFEIESLEHPIIIHTLAGPTHLFGNSKNVTSYEDIYNTTTHRHRIKTLTIGFVFKSNIFVLKARNDHLFGVYINLDQLTEVLTKGSPPRYSPGFTATYADNKLYLTNSGSGTVHYFDAETFTWGSSEVPGFVGSRNGCLVLYNKYLIHAFGVEGKSYNKYVSVVDTITWNLVPMLFVSKKKHQYDYCDNEHCFKRHVTKRSSKSPLKLWKHALDLQAQKISSTKAATPPSNDNEFQKPGKADSSSQTESFLPVDLPKPLDSPPNPPNKTELEVNSQTSPFLPPTEPQTYAPEVVYTLIATLIVIILLLISTLTYIYFKHKRDLSTSPPPPPKYHHELVWADPNTRSPLDTKFHMPPEESFDMSQTYP